MCGNRKRRKASTKYSIMVHLLRIFERRRSRRRRRRRRSAEMRTERDLRDEKTRGRYGTARQGGTFDQFICMKYYNLSFDLSFPLILKHLF
jgi:hypothetical protein